MYSDNATKTPGREGTAGFFHSYGTTIQSYLTYVLDLSVKALCSEAPPEEDFMTRSLLWGCVNIVIG